MIFVTVGGQLPFDRLVHAADQWAHDQGRQDVFAQIGASEAPPEHIEWARFLSPQDFKGKARAAEAIVAHAGMGSILTALELGKPIIVMPRRAHLGEHRNDHQWATVGHLTRGVDISVATNETELSDLLARLPELPRPTDHRSPEYSRLLSFLCEAVGRS